jgi:hypothetical protein
MVARSLYFAHGLTMEFTDCIKLEFDTNNSMSTKLKKNYILDTRTKKGS